MLKGKVGKAFRHCNIGRAKRRIQVFPNRTGGPHAFLYGMAAGAAGVSSAVSYLTNFTSTERYVSLVCSRLANSMPGSRADAVPAATAQRTQSGKSFFLTAAHT